MVGSVIDGIDVMGWSPDQDLVVMVTGVRNIIIMTREFDVLLEVSIFNSEFGEGTCIVHTVLYYSLSPSLPPSLSLPPSPLPPSLQLSQYRLVGVRKRLSFTAHSENLRHMLCPPK